MLKIVYATIGCCNWAGNENGELLRKSTHVFE